MMDSHNEAMEQPPQQSITMQVVQVTIERALSRARQAQRPLQKTRQRQAVPINLTAATTLLNHDGSAVMHTVTQLITTSGVLNAEETDTRVANIRQDVIEADRASRTSTSMNVRRKQAQRLPDSRQALSNMLALATYLEATPDVQLPVQTNEGLGTSLRMYGDQEDVEEQKEKDVKAAEIAVQAAARAEARRLRAERTVHTAASQKPSRRTGRKAAGTLDNISRRSSGIEQSGQQLDDPKPAEPDTSGMMST